MAFGCMLLVPKVSVLDKYNVSAVVLTSNSHLFKRKQGQLVNTVRCLNGKPLHRDDCQLLQIAVTLCLKLALTFSFEDDFHHLT